MSKQVKSRDWVSLGDQFSTAESWKWWEKGDAERAKYFYAQAVKAEPSIPELWYKLSLCTKVPESLDCIKKALQIDPINFEYLYRQAYLLAFYSDNGEEAGLQAAIELVRMNPDNARGLILLSEIAQEKARLTDWRILTNIDELMMIAKSFSEAERHCDALKVTDRAIEIDPKNKYLWTTKYFNLVNADRYDEAASIPDELLTFKFIFSIREFCVTGNFGPVKLGMTRNEVHSLLGSPEAAYGEDSAFLLRNESNIPADDLYPIWSYGCIELFWGSRKGKLIRISCKQVAYAWESASLTMRIDPWIYQKPYKRSQVVVPSILMDDFITGLNIAGIKFEDKGRQDFGSFWLGSLMLSSGVEALYEEDEFGEITIGLLHHKNASFDTGDKGK